LKTAGTQKLIATDTTAADLTGSQSVTVTPAALDHLVVKGFPSPTVAGSVQTFDVSARDAYDNIVTDYRGTVHFTSSDPHATLPENYPFIASDNGSHTFGAILATGGVQSLTATQLGGGVTGSQTGIVVTPAAATHFVLSGPAQVQADVAFELVVTAYDAYGNVATGYTGTVTFSSSDPDASVPQDYTFTAGDAGQHTFQFMLHQPGQQTITALDLLMSSVSGSTSMEVLPPG
jgi:hypothetical protein